MTVGVGTGVTVGVGTGVTVGVGTGVTVGVGTGVTVGVGSGAGSSEPRSIREGRSGANGGGGNCTVAGAAISTRRWGDRSFARLPATRRREPRGETMPRSTCAGTRNSRVTSRLSHRRPRGARARTMIEPSAGRRPRRSA